MPVPSLPVSQPVLPYVRETLATIRRRVGKLMGVVEWGFCSAGTSTSFTSSFINRYPDNGQPFIGALATIIQGTGQGQSRPVTATVQSTGVATVSPAWTTTPDATSLVEVWRGGYDIEQVNNCINLAVVDAQEVVWVNDRQAAPSQDATNFQFVGIPPTFLAVYRMLTLNPSSGAWTTYSMGSDPSWLDEHPNTAVPVGNQLYINPRLTASIPLANIYVCGYRLPALLVNDTDMAEVRSDFLVFKAATLLEAKDAGGTDIDPEQHGGRSSNWEREAMIIREQLPTPVEPDTRLVTP